MCSGIHLSKTRPQAISKGHPNWSPYLYLTPCIITNPKSIVQRLVCLSSEEPFHRTNHIIAQDNLTTHIKFRLRFWINVMPVMTRTLLY